MDACERPAVECRRSHTLKVRQSRIIAGAHVKPSLTAQIALRFQRDYHREREAITMQKHRDEPEAGYTSSADRKVAHTRRATHAIIAA